MGVAELYQEAPDDVISECSLQSDFTRLGPKLLSNPGECSERMPIDCFYKASASRCVHCIVSPKRKHRRNKYSIRAKSFYKSAELRQLYSRPN